MMSKHILLMAAGAALGYYATKTITVGGQIQGTAVNLAGAATGAWLGWYLARKL